MLQSSSQSRPPVRAKLLVDMVYHRERRSAGEVIEMPYLEYAALRHRNVVEEAPPPATGKK